MKQTNKKLTVTLLATMLLATAGHALATGKYESERDNYTPTPTSPPPVTTNPSAYGGNVGPIYNTPQTHVNTNPNAYGGNVGPVTNAPHQSLSGHVSGANTLSGTVSGENTGVFKNDGRQRQETNVDARSGNVTDNSRTSNTAGGATVGIDSRTSSSVSGSGNSPSSSRSNGGASSATGNGAGNVTNVSTANTYKHIEVPVLFNPTPPSVSPSTMGIKETFACGPLHQVMMVPVTGTQVGTFSKTEVSLGNDYSVTPVRDQNGDQVYYEQKTFTENGVAVHRRFGSQIVLFYALPNVSGASSFSIGFAGSNGGGSGGAGSSSAMQRPVVRAEIVSCELPGAYKMVPEKTVMGLTRDDLLATLQEAKLATKIEVIVPHDRVERKTVLCKVEEFTDSSGKKISMCRGTTTGQRTITNVVRETATGRASSAAELKK